MVGEEAPAMLAVFVREEYSHPVLLCQCRATVVVPPYYAEKEGSCRSHDGNVWKDPAAVVAWKRVDYFEEEWMVRDGAHDVV
jgi:hypothetical protein